jgi:hypothetical protein
MYAGRQGFCKQISPLPHSKERTARTKSIDRMPWKHSRKINFCFPHWRRKIPCILVGGTDEFVKDETG